MSRAIQSCLIGLIAVFVAVQSCLGESETDSHSKKTDSTEITSPVPAQDASLSEEDKEELKTTIFEMMLKQY